MEFEWFIDLSCVCMCVAYGFNSFGIHWNRYRLNGIAHLKGRSSVQQAERWFFALCACECMYIRALTLCSMTECVCFSARPEPRQHKKANTMNVIRFEKYVHLGCCSFFRAWTTIFRSLHHSPAMEFQFDLMRNTLIDAHNAAQWNWTAKKDNNKILSSLRIAMRQKIVKLEIQFKVYVLWYTIQMHDPLDYIRLVVPRMINMAE